MLLLDLTGWVCLCVRCCRQRLTGPATAQARADVAHQGQDVDKVCCAAGPTGECKGHASDVDSGSGGNRVSYGSGNSNTASAIGTPAQPPLRSKLEERILQQRRAEHKASVLHPRVCTLAHLPQGGFFAAVHSINAAVTRIADLQTGADSCACWTCTNHGLCMLMHHRILSPFKPELACMCRGHTADNYQHSLQSLLSLYSKILCQAR